MSNARMEFEEQFGYYQCGINGCILEVHHAGVCAMPELKSRARHAKSATKESAPASPKEAAPAFICSKPSSPPPDEPPCEAIVPHNMLAPAGNLPAKKRLKRARDDYDKAPREDNASPSGERKTSRVGKTPERLGVSDGWSQGAARLWISNSNSPASNSPSSPAATAEAVEAVDPVEAVITIVRLRLKGAGGMPRVAKSAAAPKHVSPLVSAAPAAERVSVALARRKQQVSKRKLARSANAAHEGTKAAAQVGANSKVTKVKGQPAKTMSKPALESVDATDATEAAAALLDIFGGSPPLPARNAATLYISVAPHGDSATAIATDALGDGSTTPPMYSVPTRLSGLPPRFGHPAASRTTLLPPASATLPVASDLAPASAQTFVHHGSQALHVPYCGIPMPIYPHQTPDSGMAYYSAMYHVHSQQPGQQPWQQPRQHAYAYPGQQQAAQAHHAAAQVHAARVNAAHSQEEQHACVTTAHAAASRGQPGGEVRGQEEEALRHMNSSPPNSEAHASAQELRKTVTAIAIGRGVHTAVTALPIAASHVEAPEEGIAKYAINEGQGHSLSVTSALATAAARARRSTDYMCGRCGQPKRGHVCAFKKPPKHERMQAIVAAAILARPENVVVAASLMRQPQSVSTSIAM